MSEQIIFVKDKVDPVCFYGNDWKLEFQTYPRKAILLHGRRPTRDEIVNVVCASALAALFIPVVEIALEYAEIQGSEDKAFDLFSDGESNE